jgi:hypothetical protein
VIHMTTQEIRELKLMAVDFLSNKDEVLVWLENLDPERLVDITQMSHKSSLMALRPPPINFENDDIIEFYHNHITPKIIKKYDNFFRSLGVTATLEWIQNSTYVLDCHEGVNPFTIKDVEFMLGKSVDMTDQEKNEAMELIEELKLETDSYGSISWFFILLILEKVNYGIQS